MSQLKDRKDVAKQDTWAVEDMYENDMAWQKAYEKLLEEAKLLATYKGKLNDIVVLVDFLTKQETMMIIASDVHGYASRCSDVDTSNSHYQVMMEQARGIIVEVGKLLSFVNVEVMAIEEEKLQEAYQNDSGLLRYKRMISDARRSMDHVLSEQEEAILAAAKEMGSAPTTTYMMLMNADMTYPDAQDEQGKKHAITTGNFIKLLQSSDRALRESAFKQYYGEYDKVKNTTASLLAAQNKQLKFFANAKNFNTPIEAALHGTNVPVSVYQNLIETVHKNIGILHKYMNLRKKIMGVESLHMYDLHVPLVDELNVNIPYDVAQQEVLNSVKILGKDYYEALKHGFENRWVDKFENKGKRSGAYSAGMNIHPFVLMNYNESLSTEFTLAHEMGHAMHSYYSTKTQNSVDRNYVIFVAEVASTCNEALLMDYLRKQSDDSKMKAYLINYVLEQFRNTVYRQTMFAEFELKISEMTMNNEALTAQSLNALYKQLNEFYYGKDVVVDDEIALEWSRIPHFYMNFYVFQYATGFSAAMTLSKRILNQEENAVEDYLTFLKGGCSQSPIDLLKGAGVDMSSPKPIEDALQLFDSLIDELDELLG